MQKLSQHVSEKEREKSKPKTGLHSRRCFSYLLSTRYDQKGTQARNYRDSRSLVEKRQEKESLSQAEG